MNYGKLVLPLIVVSLGASFMHEASAWGTGGSIGTPRKGFETLQLYCDLSDPRSKLTIETTPSNAAPTTRPSFKLSGPVVCGEVPIGVLSPTLPGDAIAFAAVSPVQGKAIGVFQLEQITDSALFPGLNYTETTIGIVTTRTWSFDVTGHDGSFPFAQLLYELKPVDAAANAFCNPLNLGVTDEPPPLDPNNCKALYGLQLPANATDYPGPADFQRTVNGITLNAGQVFTFSTKTEGGVEKALALAWAPCHTQRFIGPLTPDVFANNNSALLTGLTVTIDPCCTSTGTGTVTGTPQTVAIPSTQTNPLHVTVQPNDLWNARNISPSMFWSNVDGLTVNLYTTGFKAIDSVSGMNYLDQLDSEAVAFFCGVAPDPECPSGTPNQIPNQIGQDVLGIFPIDGFAAPPGSLVGRVGPDYYLLGTASTVPESGGQNLDFFYWDANALNNVGSVKVTVATDSIQCKVGDTFIPPTTGVLRVSSSVEVVYKPTLNVRNKSTSANFPTTIVGCSNYNPPFVIESDGHPIMTSETKVLVNGVEVPFKKFNVADTISRPSCDGGQSLPDLKLDLNRKKFIDVVAPGGKCKNGDNMVKVEIGSDTPNGGWYSGTGVVGLSKCK